jgi:sec-independent protein translocase protein TatA
LARVVLRTEEFMGSLSIWHWLVVGAVLLLVFGGRNKISDMMGDVAKGIKAFKKGMADEDTEAKSDAPVKSIDHQGAADIQRRAESESKVAS